MEKQRNRSRAFGAQATPKLSKYLNSYYHTNFDERAFVLSKKISYYLYFIPKNIIFLLWKQIGAINSNLEGRRLWSIRIRSKQRSLSWTKESVAYVIHCIVEQYFPGRCSAVPLIHDEGQAFSNFSNLALPRYHN